MDELNLTNLDPANPKDLPSIIRVFANKLETISNDIKVLKQRPQRWLIIISTAITLIAVLTGGAFKMMNMYENYRIVQLQEQIKQQNNKLDNILNKLP